MSGAAQYAFVLCIQRVDVSGSSEGLGRGGRVGQCADGGGAVSGGYTGSAAFQFVDSDSKRSAQHGCIVDYLMWQVELLTAGHRDGGTDTPGMFQHEVDFFRCDEFGGDNQVTFILTVFIVDHDYEFSLAE